jgi:hypothetical protein
MRTVRLRCPRAPSNAAAPGRGFWPMSWSANTPTIFPCIVRARSSTAKASTSIAPLWPTGSASPPPCWNRWPMPSGAMFSPPRRSLPMIRRCRCWHPALARRRPPGSGPMSATSVPGAGWPHRPHGIGSPATAKASTPRTISPASEAGCMPMATPGSRTCIAPAPSARSPAWPMFDASSSTSTDPKPPRSPKRPSAGSRNSMPSRKWPEAPRRIAAPTSAVSMPPRSSTIWSDGWQ